MGQSQIVIARSPAKWRIIFPILNGPLANDWANVSKRGFGNPRVEEFFGKRLGEGFLGMKFYLRICWLDWWGISWLAPCFFDVSMSLHAWIRIYQKIFLKVAYVWIGFVGLLCVLWREQNVSKCDFSFFLPETVLFSTSRSGKLSTFPICKPPPWGSSSRDRMLTKIMTNSAIAT